MVRGDTLLRQGNDMDRKIVSGVRTEHVFFLHGARGTDGKEGLHLEKVKVKAEINVKANAKAELLIEVLDQGRKWVVM